MKSPPPPVNFVEWDGLVRLLFNRKHKTLRAVLSNKETLRMLSDNLRTHAALHGAGTDMGAKAGTDGAPKKKPAAKSRAARLLAEMSGENDAMMAMGKDADSGAGAASATDGGDDDDDDEMGGAAPAASANMGSEGGARSQQHANVRALLEDVLADPRFIDRRAANMDQDDFLALLAAFNARGLHFS